MMLNGDSEGWIFIPHPNSTMVSHSCSLLKTAFSYFKKRLPEVPEYAEMQYTALFYDWRESCLLIGPICLHKSLCLPGKWSKPVHRFILHENQLELVFRSEYFDTSAILPSRELKIA